MAMTMTQFRAEVARRRGDRSRGAPRYPEAMRAFAVAHGQAVTARGETVASAARTLGITDVTLAAWMKALGSSRMRRVEVVAAQPPSAGVETTVTVTAPSGHTVTGLSVAEAAELLRALS